MATAAIERLYKLGVDGTQAIKMLEKIAGNTDELNKSFGRVTDTVKDFAKGFIAWETVKAAVSGFGQLVEVLGDLDDQAQQLALSTDAMQELNGVAKLAGVGAETMTTAFAGLAKTMTEVEGGTSDTARVLKALGVDLKGLSNEEAFFKLADLFKELPDGAQKSALAMELFGKAGQKLVPLLSQGSAAIRETADQMHKLGLVASKEAIQAAADLGDSWDLLKGQATGLVVLGLTPMMTKLAEMTRLFNDARVKGEGFFGALGETAKAFRETPLEEYNRRLRESIANHEHMQTTFGKWPGFVDKVAELDQEMRDLGSTIHANALAEESGATATMAATNADKDRIANARLAAEAAKKAEEERKKAAKDREAELKRQKELYDEVTYSILKQSKAEDDLRQKIAPAAKSPEQTRIEQDVEAREALRKQMEGDSEALRKQQAELEVLWEWLEKGTEAQRKFAEAQIFARDQTGKASETIGDYQGALNRLVESNVQSFFDNIQNGALKAKDAFQQMVSSILAQLLRLVAQKAIFKAFGLDIGGTGVNLTQKALGGVFNRGHELSAFARGGIVSRPTLFPMANGAGLMGEAGPEGIFPLQRTATGELGVQGVAPIVNVHVTSTIPGSTGSVRQQGNEVQVLIEQTKASIRADILAGGNSTSSAFERVYGVGRSSGMR